MTKADREIPLSNLLKRVANGIGNFANRYQHVCIFTVFALSFAIKYIIAINVEGFGTDYGAYLRLADVVGGLDITARGLRYPPIFPILLAGFRVFLDDITALKVCAAFLFSIVAIPFFFLSKKVSRNPIIPIIAALLVAFNLFYSEMIGWGGNANILALALMIAFLVFFINSLEDGRGKLDPFLASIFMSLSVGAHFLVGLYIIIFLGVFLFLVLLLRSRLKLDKAIKKTFLIGSLGLVLSIPYLPSYGNLLGSPIVGETIFAVADQRSLVDITYPLSKQLFNIILVFLSVVGIYILVTRKNKLLGLIATTLFASACLPLFTQDSNRWLYFWPVPMFLGIAALVDELLRVGKKNLRNIRKTTLTVAVGILILVYLVSSVSYMQETVAYYDPLSSDSLTALKWIRNYTAPDSVIATSGPYRRGAEGTGQNYGWWIEGYAERRCIATSYLRFLIYNDERTLAEKANMMFSGTDVISNDCIMAAETLGIQQGNPELGANIGDFFEKLLFFADNETMITWKNGLSSSNVTLAQMKDKQETVYLDETEATITVVYSDENGFFRIDKEISISIGSSTVNVSFRIQQKVNITEVDIPIFKSDFTDLDSLSAVTSKAVTVYLITPVRAYAKIDIWLEYAGNVEARVSESSTLEEKSELVRFTILNPAENPSLQFKITLPEFVISNLGPLRYFSARNLISSLGVNYIFANKNRTREIEWLLSDKTHFSEEFQNDEIAVFKVELVS